MCRAGYASSLSLQRAAADALRPSSFRVKLAALIVKCRVGAAPSALGESIRPMDKGSLDDAIASIARAARAGVVSEPEDQAALLGEIADVAEAVRDGRDSRGALEVLADHVAAMIAGSS